MKITYRIPTSEPYAYVEVEQDLEKLDPVLITANYRDLTDAFTLKEGIGDKDFDQFIENQVSGKTNQLEVYNQMSDQQKWMVQVNKRAIKRVLAKKEQ